MIASTETSMSSPIMMLWFDFLVSTNIVELPPCSPRDQRNRTSGSFGRPVRPRGGPPDQGRGRRPRLRRGDRPGGGGRRADRPGAGGGGARGRGRAGPLRGRRGRGRGGAAEPAAPRPPQRATPAEPRQVDD